MSRKEAAAYLAAIIDGEGTVSVARGAKPFRAVRIINTDPDIIEATMECCRRLGIDSRVSVKNIASERKQKCWVVTISSKRNIEKVSKLPIRARSKRERLLKLLSSYTGG